MQLPKYLLPLVCLTFSSLLVLPFSFFQPGYLILEDLEPHGNQSYHLDLFENASAPMPTAGHHFHIASLKNAKNPTAHSFVARLSSPDLSRAFNGFIIDGETSEHSISPDQSSAEYSGKFSNEVKFVLKSIPAGGTVDVSFGNGFHERWFLQSHSPLNITKSISYPLEAGRFSIPAPRLAIKKIKIESLSLASLPLSLRLSIKGPLGTVPLKFDAKSNSFSLTKPDPRISPWSGIEWFSKLVGTAVLFFMFLLLGQFIIRQINILKSPDTCKNRIAPTLLFLGQFTPLFLWWGSYFPAAMSQDSFHSWQNTRLLIFENFHPYLYSFYILIFRFIHDSPATLTLFQVCGTAAISAYVFNKVRNYQVSIWIWFPFYVLLALSIPVGQLTVTAWKDVPFAMGVIWLSGYLFFKLLNFKYGKYHVLQLKRQELFAISAGILFLSLLRHNAIVYIVWIPLILLFWNPKQRSFIHLFLLTIAGLLLFRGPVESYLNVQANTNLPYLSIAWKMNPIASMIANPYKKYYSRSRSQNEKDLQRVMNIETMKNLYDPSSHGPICWDRKNFDRSLNQQESDKISKIYWKTAIENLNIFTADRSYMFFTSMGAARGKVFISTANGLLRNRPQHHWAHLGDLQFSPLFPNFYKKFDRVLKRSLSFRGVEGGRFIFWNALWPILLLVGIFLLYGWLPILATICSIYILQLPILYLFSPSSEFRYFYFIFWFGYLVLPLAACEIRARKRVHS